jgi:hypothetical protein
MPGYDYEGMLGSIVWRSRQRKAPRYIAIWREAEVRVSRLSHVARRADLWCLQIPKYLSSILGAKLSSVLGARNKQCFGGQSDDLS